jgi:hypothetical protein
MENCVFLNEKCVPPSWKSAVVAWSYWVPLTSVVCDPTGSQNQNKKLEK